MASPRKRKDRTEVERRQSKSLPILVVPDKDLTNDQMNEIIASFEVIDINSDGRISKGELVKAAALIGMNPTDEDVDAMLRSADLDGDGFISFHEYKNIMRENYISIDIETERMLTAFKIIDTNQDGFLSRSELKLALCYRCPLATDDVIENLLDEADINKDGKIDYREFVSSKLCRKIF